jgi:uncharacterized protein
MPWSVKRSSDCPDDKPWSVVNDETGASEGCHATEDDAKRQQAALYANADDAETRSSEDEAETRSVDFDKLGDEYRAVALTDLETSEDGGTFEGYAAIFDAEADLGDFTESVQRGAFRKALSSEDGSIPLLYEHNMMLPPLASTGGGTLQLEEDAKGLRVRAELAKHFLGDAVRENMKRGDIRGMSFGFVAGAGNSRIERRAGKPHRSLVGFKRILEVTLTPDPVYAGTEAGFRSLAVVQLAESLQGAQQVLLGAYQQPEDGEPPAEADAGDGEEEARSGAGEVAASHLLAAKRRLRVMQATIPKEYRQ